MGRPVDHLPGGLVTNRPPALEDLVGIEHSKLGFFQELRQKIEELETAHKNSEEQRREIAAILDGITDVMMVLSENLRIISVNHVFRDIFDEPHPEGKHCYELFRNEKHPCPECPAFRSLATNTVCRNTAIFKLKGRNLQFDMVASPLKSPEWSEHRVLIFKRDVTLEKEYQAKYYQVEKMAAVGMLAAGVAHEVNNPLAAILGFAEGLRRRMPRIQDHVPEDLAEDVQEYTDIILKECHRCQKIIQTLLTFSRPMSAAFSPLPLNQLVTDTLRLVDHHLRNRQGVKIQLHLADNLPLVYGDESQLKQVVLNLLVNALDAIQGEGLIMIRTSSAAGEQVCLCVEDTGCGIPPENLDKMFEPFFTTKPVGKGIGIGLASCYNIVQEHSGEISVTSELGKGSRFTVCLPLNPDEGPRERTLLGTRR
jgi:two-component system, NtrC family, sensor kinase